MSKGLEALEIINIKLKDKNNNYDRRVVNCNNEYLYLIKEEELSIIENALKRLEQLEEDFMSLTETNMELVQEQAKNRKKLKALEAIKDLCGLKLYKNKLGQCFLEGTHILFAISQEKYDLLREVLP